jgi:hypothetical protein
MPLKYNCYDDLPVYTVLSLSKFAKFVFSIRALLFVLYVIGEWLVSHFSDHFIYKFNEQLLYQLLMVLVLMKMLRKKMH